MPSLFENAVSSIRMGVEDFKQQDPDRDISAVRNFYAGILLLAKEAIIRKAPNADPSLVIGGRLRLVSDGDGGIQMERVGHTTIDFQQIKERAASFGVELDGAALHDLNRLRNDLEHHYTAQSSNAIRAALSKGFPVAASLFRQMEEDPLQLLGDSWRSMLETKELYDQELRAARATLEKVAWISNSINDPRFRCTSCGSELIEQVDPQNDDQDFVELQCRTCGENPELSALIEQRLEDVYRSERYSRFKDAGEDGPVFQCPACSCQTLVEHEDGCAACGEHLDYISECRRCSNEIGVQEYLEGMDGGFCSYCVYQYDKMMSED